MELIKTEFPELVKCKSPNELYTYCVFNSLAPTMSCDVMIQTLLFDDLNNIYVLRRFVNILMDLVTINDREVAHHGLFQMIRLIKSSRTYPLQRNSPIWYKYPAEQEFYKCLMAICDCWTDWTYLHDGEIQENGIESYVGGTVFVTKGHWKREHHGKYFYVSSIKTYGNRLGFGCKELDKTILDSGTRRRQSNVKYSLLRYNDDKEEIFISYENLKWTRFYMYKPIIISE